MMTNCRHSYSMKLTAVTMRAVMKTICPGKNEADTDIWTMCCDSICTHSNNRWMGQHQGIGMQATTKSRMDGQKGDSKSTHFSKRSMHCHVNSNRNNPSRNWTATTTATAATTTTTQWWAASGRAAKNKGTSISNSTGYNNLAAEYNNTNPTDSCNNNLKEMMKIRSWLDLSYSD